MMKSTTEKSNEIRLQKWLATAGVASRRKAEAMILDGRISLNGKVVTELGAKGNPNTDVLYVDGKPIDSDAPDKVYIMLHKPEGVVTTVTDPQNRPTVMDYIPANIRLYPVGRLDYYTSGLLLMTNDGDWAHKLTHPKHEVKKTYVAVIKGIPNQTALKSLRSGVDIDGQRTAPCEVSIIDTHPNGNTKLRITIHEGRNRQVRKMCEAIGHPAISLKRTNIGALSLGGLQRGKWRDLTSAEVRELSL